MISYWSSRYGHACPAINYFKVTFFGTFIIWTESVLHVSGCYMSCILLYVCPGILLAVCPVSCWPKFQSIFNGLQSIATDGQKHYQCQNIVLNKEGDMGVYGIAVLGFFSCGISVISILTCGIAVSSSSAVCGFSSFWLTVFGEIRLFTVLRYRLFALSFRYNTLTIRKTKHSTT